MKLDRECFRNEKISRILLHMAPPVMLAQLIQALYNIIDSFFIGQYSLDGLTALSVIYPIQLLMIAIAVGGAYDPIYIDRITRYASMKYNRRFLHDIKTRG